MDASRIRIAKDLLYLAEMPSFFEKNLYKNLKIRN